MTDMDALCEQARVNEGLAEDAVPAIALVLELLKDEPDNEIPDKDLDALIGLVEYWEVANAAKLGQCKAAYRRAIVQLHETKQQICDLYAENRQLQRRVQTSCG